MSSLYRFNPAPLYMKAITSARPHHFFALGIARWLRRLAEQLEQKNLPFEACDAEDLATEFERFGQDDNSAEGFGVLWQEFENWGETTIISGGREKSLCSIPQLPNRLAY